jgi:LPS export ABC transporter permease LptF/LPS export ABC transporter permease LptG
MRILTRYILSEVISHALIGAALFTFVLFTRDLGRVLDIVVRASAPVPSVLQIFFFTLPVAFTYTIPMAVLVGILIGLSRLAADSEITAMRASGIGVWTFVRVIGSFAVVAWALAMFNGAYLAPESQAALGHLQDKLKTSQASFEVQPRVFYEGFPKLVLYVQDVRVARGAAIWKGVFIADTSTPGSPRITMAKQGVLVSEGPQLLHLHLSNGATHEIDPKLPDKYQISTFDSTDLPITVAEPENKEQEPTPIGELSTRELWQQARTAKKYVARWDLIEFHRRFALPTSCLVLALVGIPLGLSSKKGGKSAGFVLTILLVFAYYSVTLVGVSLARQGKLSPALGAWLANIVFLVAGLFLLWRAERRPIEIPWLRGRWDVLKMNLRIRMPGRTMVSDESAFTRQSTRTRVFSARFPMLLDDLVLRDFFVYLAMVLGALLTLLLVFTVFELLGDILRNRISPLVVGEYLLNVTPFFLYNIAHLGMLIAVLITFGLMQRSNEITAIKATGISIYRVVVPVLVASVMVAGGLFAFDQFYLPHANKRQDALRNLIKGKPPQTYLNPERKWIVGQHSTIYYYQFFDPYREEFANLSVFKFDPATFQLIGRLYSDRAHWEQDLDRWVCERGWERSLQGPSIAEFRNFDVSTFAFVDEPPSYFTKKVEQSSEMNYGQLRGYIHELQQSGFDVIRLKVALQEKLAFPLSTFIMAVLAIPFALSPGKRSAVTGIATAVGIGLVYIVLSRLSESMGNASQLPPMLAAWAPEFLFGLAGGYLILKVPT